MRNSGKHERGAGPAHTTRRARPQTSHAMPGEWARAPGRNWRTAVITRGGDRRSRREFEQVVGDEGFEPPTYCV